MADQALDGPGSGVTERANGVTLDLLCHIEQQFDFPLLGLRAFGGGQSWRIREI